MAINYTETDTAAVCTINTYCATGSFGGTALLKQASDGGTAGTTEILPSVVASATDHVKLLFEIVPTSTSWDAGTWTVRFNVTTQNMNVSWSSVYICRVNSSCTNQATIGSSTGLGISLGSPGVKSTTVTGSSQSPSAGDKVLVLCLFDNSAMTNQTVGITPDQNIDSPFNPAAFTELELLGRPYGALGASQMRSLLGQ